MADHIALVQRSAAYRSGCQLPEDAAVGRLDDTGGLAAQFRYMAWRDPLRSPTETARIAQSRGAVEAARTERRRSRTARADDPASSRRRARRGRAQARGPLRLPARIPRRHGRTASPSDRRGPQDTRRARPVLGLSSRSALLSSTQRRWMARAFRDLSSRKEEGRNRREPP